jgi:fatty acid desaturase
MLMRSRPSWRMPSRSRRHHPARPRRRMAPGYFEQRLSALRTRRRNRTVLRPAR